MALAGYAMSARDWNLSGTGWGEAIMVPLLLILCIWPLLQWYLIGMRWLPLGEAFLAVHIPFYVFPSLYGDLDWLGYPMEQRFFTLVAVAVFLLSCSLAYRFCFRVWKDSFQVGGILKREIRVSVIWTMLAIWVFWNVLSEYGWLPDMGDQINVFRSCTGACGSISIVYLCYQMGLRQLTPGARFLLITGLIAGLVTNIASGFLVTAAGTMATGLFAFAVGRKRLPVFIIMLCIAILGFLHLGKSEYRATYWEEGKDYSSNHDVDLASKYATWIRYSWNSLESQQGETVDEADFFHRVVLLNVLVTVMDATPSRLDYLNGITYEILPNMLLPRFFWPDKPRGSLPTEFLSVHYGFQTREATDFTSITMGPIVEAWANFGWCGLIGAGVFFGFLFGIPARISSSLVPRQFGWLLASIFLVYSVDLTHCIVEMICSLLEGLLTGFIALFIVSRWTRRAEGLLPTLSEGNSRRILQPVRN